MVIDRTVEYLEELVKELIKLPAETEWVEFKVNMEEPDKVGEYISALSNSAAILGKSSAYIIWGVDDRTHEIVGTKFSPMSKKCGAEDFINWLTGLVQPNSAFSFSHITLEDKQVVILEIPAAQYTPVLFKGISYIRVGSYKKKLKEHPEKERMLWGAFSQGAFEHGIAAEKLKSDEVLNLLYYSTYFDLLKKSLPSNKDSILKALASDDLITPTDAKRWNITNLGAILFARDITNFKELKRKTIRVIFYKGTDKIETEREEEFKQGYAYSFENIVNYTTVMSPQKEIMEKGLRKTVSMFPDVAVRELIANAIIHQDFYITGTAPTVEVFSDRIEITNPGRPLVDVNRFLDNPPRSRNEHIASLLRRIGVCEERGSGIDKVVAMTELYQLPAPIFETTAEHTRVILFAHRNFNEIDRDSRIRATYLHASLKYVERKGMTNKTLRERFELEPKNSATISRIIKDTMEKGFIKCQDNSVGAKAKKYIPFWA